MPAIHRTTDVGTTAGREIRGSHSALKSLPETCPCDHKIATPRPPGRPSLGGFRLGTKTPCTAHRIDQHSPNFGRSAERSSLTGSFFAHPCDPELPATVGPRGMTHFSISLFRLLKIAVGWVEFPCPTIISMVCHTGSGVGTTAGREIRVEAKLPARDLSLLPQRRDERRPPIRRPRRSGGGCRIITWSGPHSTVLSTCWSRMRPHQHGHSNLLRPLRD